MTINVEVAFAERKRQLLILVQVSESCTVRQAIQQSKILQQLPTVDLTNHKVGIFGKLCSLETLLQAGDRVEIYRALIKDPKINRLERAKKQTNRSENSPN